MIRLTRLNRATLVVNSDLIEHIENTPDTIVIMTTGQKFIVLESPDVVVDKIREFRRSVGCGWAAGGARSTAPAEPGTEESN